MRIDHDKCQLKEGTEERDRQAERIVRESRQVRVEQVKSQPLGCFCCYIPKLKSKGLSIYYVIRNGEGGSSRFITILHRGGLESLLQLGQSRPLAGMA